MAMGEVRVFYMLPLEAPFGEGVNYFTVNKDTMTEIRDLQEQALAGVHYARAYSWVLIHNGMPLRLDQRLDALDTDALNPVLIFRIRRSCVLLTMMKSEGLLDPRTYDLVPLDHDPTEEDLAREPEYRFKRIIFRFNEMKALV